MTCAATLLLVIGLGLEIRNNGIANGQSSTSDWITKVKMYFSFMDANGNGVVSEDDVQLLIDRFISTDNGNEDRKAEIRSIAYELYKGFSSVAGGLQFKESAFIDGLQKLKDSEEFKAVYRNWIARFFIVLDHNGDGSLDIPEFARFLLCFGLPDLVNTAVNAIKAADTNGDGLLDSSEFIMAKVDFITSDNKSGPGRLLFGPVRDILRLSGGLLIG